MTAHSYGQEDSEPPSDQLEVDVYSSPAGEKNSTSSRT